MPDVQNLFLPVEHCVEPKFLAALAGAKHLLTLELTLRMPCGSGASPLSSARMNQRLQALCAGLRKAAFLPSLQRLSLRFRGETRMELDASTQIALCKTVSEMQRLQHLRLAMPTALFTNSALFCERLVTSLPKTLHTLSFDVYHSDAMKLMKALLKRFHPTTLFDFDGDSRLQSTLLHSTVACSGQMPPVPAASSADAERSVKRSRTT